MGSQNLTYTICGPNISLGTFNIVIYTLKVNALSEVKLLPRGVNLTQKITPYRFDTTDYNGESNF